MSIHQIGNSQSSERKNILQRSSGSSAVLGDMVRQQTLTVKIHSLSSGQALCHLQAQIRLCTVCPSCICSGHMLRVHAERSRRPCGYMLKRKSKRKALSQYHHSRYCKSAYGPLILRHRQCMLKEKMLQYFYLQQNKKTLALSQQAVLQLLVLTQEQERKHLVKLVHGVSLEDLQEPGCTVPPKEDKSIFSSFSAACLSELVLLLYSPTFYVPPLLFPVSYADSQKQTAFRNGCIKRLRQIHAGLQTRNETQTPLKQTNLQPQLQQPQPQMQAHISSEPAMWSQHQLEDCSLLLLTHLMELQEVQASALLPRLMDKVSHDNHSIQSKDSTITHTVTVKIICVSVRVHSVSKLCETSMNLNFKHSATQTHSSSWSQMPLLLQVLYSLLIQT